MSSVASQRDLLRAMMAVLLFCSAAFAAQNSAVIKRIEEPRRSSPLQDRGYSLQETDDPAFLFVPAKPLTAAEKNRDDSLAWFMAGRLLEARNEPRMALNAYRKAIAIEPRAIEVYRHLVPLEFRLDEVESAVQTAVKAVEIDPHEYELLQMLAGQAAILGRLPDAIRYLEQAAKSPRVVKESPENVVLNKSLGMLYSVTGQVEKAADCYEVIFDALTQPDKYKIDLRGKAKLLADPQTGYEKIGQVFLDAKRIQRASEAFELAAKSGKVGPGNLNYNRSRVLLLSDKPEEALAELQKYFDSQRQSKGREAYQLLADILDKMNQADELIPRLETLAEKDPHYIPLQYFLADRLVAANELEKAKSIYETALRNGGDSSGLIGLAQVLRKLHRPDELLDLLGRSLTKLGPDGLAQLEVELKVLGQDADLVDSLMVAGRLQATSTPPKINFEKSYLLGGIAKACERTDDAIEFYGYAIKLGKDRAVGLYRELGVVLEHARRYSEAVALYTEALNEPRLFGIKDDLFSYLARAQVLDGDANGAIESIGEALKLKPDNVSHQYEEAWIYSHSRQWDIAIARFEKLISANVENKQAQRLFLFSLSNIYVQKGEFRKGEEILEKVFESDPQDIQLNNDLGYMWADQGKNLDKAEQMIRKAVVSEPENGAYLDSLGWVLFKRGKYQEALGPLEQAVKKNTGGDATLWDHLADVQFQLMQLDKAFESWQRALKSAEADKFSDPQLIERLKDKLKQHAPDQNPPKPAQAGSP
jgi:tetratricopeptide (TPR) repeat protein